MPTILKAICPPYEKWEECYSIDFSGTLYDDIILLDHVNGPFTQKGYFKGDPKTTVVALRENSTDAKIQVILLCIFEILNM